VDNALAVYLPFYSEKGKISEDATQNKNDEKFVGNIKLVAGKFGSGIELDGQSYVGIPWSDSIDVVDEDLVQIYREGICWESNLGLCCRWWKTTILDSI